MTAFLYGACFLLLGFVVGDWFLRRAVVASAERITRAYAPSD